MVSIFDLRYTLLSRNYFSEKVIPRMYSQVRENIVKPAVTKASFYVVTTDLWTSYARHPFMSFTIHFIDDKWKLKTFYLDTVLTTHAKAWLKLLRVYWQIGNSIQPIWCVRQLIMGWTFYQHSMFWTGWGSAALGTIRICVNNAIQMDRIQRALTRCHSLVGVFNRSWKNTGRNKFNFVLTNTSLFLMLQHGGEEQQKAIITVLTEDRRNWHHIPTDQELWLWLLY